MGRRGKAPTPTIIQIKKGDPGRRARKQLKVEPQPPAIKMTCPSWLNATAKREWKRIMKMFMEMERKGQRVITEADRAILVGYCQAWADLVKSIKMIEEQGEVFVFKKDNGSKYIQQSPYVAIKNKSLIALKSYAVEFGLTPAARSRIQILPQENKNDLEEEMFGS